MNILKPCFLSYLLGFRLTSAVENAREGESQIAHLLVGVATQILDKPPVNVIGCRPVNQINDY